MIESDLAAILETALMVSAEGVAHPDEVRAALVAVLRLHSPSHTGIGVYCTACLPADTAWPCKTVATVGQVLHVSVTRVSR